MYNLCEQINLKYRIVSNVLIYIASPGCIVYNDYIWLYDKIGIYE